MRLNAAGMALTVSGSAHVIGGDFASITATEAIARFNDTATDYTGAGAVDQIDRRLFEDSGSDTCQNIFLGLALEYDIVDPGKVEKPPEKQA